ncbi:MAG: hypothetical protein CMN10_06595 [Roseobacter sp.]|nr:hypothetical protein [Roseobacter sp.]|tara:strand:+ start:34699 stop:34995 length:297 start_codon:yes stop_codon:yes gene_type:complete
MTSLAQMRSEVARDHGWHEDDDGDRIDEVLNERFGQAAVEMYEALEDASECAEIIDNLIKGIERHGNYSVESTLMFLRQARIQTHTVEIALAIARGEP